MQPSDKPTNVTIFILNYVWSKFRIQTDPMESNSSPCRILEAFPTFRSLSQLLEWTSEPHDDESCVIILLIKHCH